MSAVHLRVAAAQQILSLIRLRARVGTSTWLSCHQIIYISRLLGFTEAAAPTQYLHYEQMCQEPEPLSQRCMTNG